MARQKRIKESTKPSNQGTEKRGISLKIALPMISVIPLVVGCAILCVLLVSQSKYLLNETISNNLYSTAITKGEAINEDILSDENVIKAYGNSVEIINLLKNPDDPEIRKEAQEYTLKQFNDLNGWEGLYAATWDSVVLTHPAEPVIGKQLREGDSLKSLQDAMLNAENGIFNVGIIVSPASGVHTTSMYMPVFDNGKPIGYVGGGSFVAKKMEKYNDVSSLGIESAYVYIVDKDGNFAYHPKEEKINTEVTNAFVKGLRERIANGEHPESECITYTNEVVKYASYYVAPNNNWIFVVTGNKDDAMAAANNMVVTAIIISIILIIVFSAIAINLALRIAKPIMTAIDDCNVIASGNLTKDISAKSSIGEIADLINGLTILREKLLLVVNNIQNTTASIISNSDNLKESVDNSIDSVSNISTAIDEVALGNNSLASNVSTQMASVEELGANIDESDTEIEAMKNVTETTVELSKQADKLMGELIEITNATKKNVDSISVQSKINVEAAEEINAITEAIADITSQTNLLSLNASIEAARAGESGRGFAVVADEIRQLADNSAQQTNHIKDIIQKLLSNIEDTNNISNDLVTSANVQLEKLDTTRITFEEVIEKINAIETNVITVSGNMNNITHIKDGVTDIAESLSAVSQQTSASSEQVASSATIVKDNIGGLGDVVMDLKELANQLKEAVSYFES